MVLCAEALSTSPGRCVVPQTGCSVPFPLGAGRAQAEFEECVQSSVAKALAENQGTETSYASKLGQV